MAVLEIAITKGKGTVPIDTETLPEEVYKEAMIQGLKVLANRGMSKITKETYPDADELKAAAMAKAQENVQAILEGDIKFTGAPKATKVSGAVNTEAMRLARNVVKDEMKRQGIKVSHVEARDITAAAKALLAEQPKIIEQAKANLEERSKFSVKGLDVKAIPISAKKKQKAEAKLAEFKATMSAKQAGKVKKRAKGGEAHA